MVISPRTPMVLIAAPEEHWLAAVLEERHYAVLKVRTAQQALQLGRDVTADAIVLDAHLPDLSGVEASRLLNSDPQLRGRVPLLILAPGTPTPEQRVAALRAGAWGFLCRPKDTDDADEIVLKLDTYVQAKRNIDAALAEGVVDPYTGLHTRSGLARRARELGALMSRKHGALACLVFALETDPPDRGIGRIVARAARVSDVVGLLGPREIGLLAPATGQGGALKLAQRVGHLLSETINGAERPYPAVALKAGYDAADDLTYAPIDPTELIARATTAVQSGIPEPTCPWVRRFDVRRALDQHHRPAAPESAHKSVFDERRKS